MENTRKFEEAILVNDAGDVSSLGTLKVKPGLPTVTVVTSANVCLPTDTKPILRKALHRFRRGLTRGDGKIIYNYWKTDYEDIPHVP